MLTDPIKTLQKMVNQPSGSFDRADVNRVAELFAEEFASLGFAIERFPHATCGTALRCTIGTGDKQLMLMGHMDTVFPHDLAVPFTMSEDGQTAKGSGVIDMKGGLVILLYALKAAIPQIDLTKYRLCAVLNPDEEIGSTASHDLLMQTAEQSFAALSFEPGAGGRFTCARKGVCDVEIKCHGIPGHAGANYKNCASAVQALCAHICALYELRDDARDISFNAGVITGGTAENVVAEDASCRCEFRFYNQAYQAEIKAKIEEICARNPVPGVTTTVTFGASHPAIDLNEKSQAVLDVALAIAKAQGRNMVHERTGGAGDISIVGQAGIAVLDGLGMEGAQMHTTEEWGRLDKMPQQIELAGELMVKLCK